MTEQLKPCPCGSKAELHESITMSGKGQFWVQSEAGWVGPVKSEPDDAIDFWNTRIDTRPTPSHVSREELIDLGEVAISDAHDYDTSYRQYAEAVIDAILPHIGGAVTMKLSAEVLALIKQARDDSMSREQFYTIADTLCRRLADELEALTPASEPDTGNTDATTIAKYDDELRMAKREGMEQAARLAEYRAEQFPEDSGINLQLENMAFIIRKAADPDGWTPLPASPGTQPDPVAEAARVLLAEFADEASVRITTAMAQVLRADIPDSAWNTESELLSAFRAALKSLAAKGGE